MNIAETIKANYSLLGRVQKKIADYVLEYPEKVCFLSVREFAKELNTTEVTIFRFLNKIGFESYNDFKMLLQEQIRNWLSPNRQIEQAVAHVDASNFEDLTQKILRSELDTLRNTYALSQMDSLHKAVDLILSARHIYIIGHEVSESLAKFLGLRLRQLNRPAEYLNMYNLETAASTLSEIDSSCLFIIISFPIYSKGSLALAKLLAKNHLNYISITDRHTSEIAIHATISFVCDNKDVIFYNSLTSTISLLNLLCSLVAVSSRGSAKDYTEHKEEKNRLDELLENLNLDLPTYFGQ